MSVATALVVAAATAILTAIASYYWQRKIEVERARRQEVAPKYEELAGLTRSVAEEAKKPKGNPQRKADEIMSQATTKLLVWGPDEVVCAYRDWIENTRQLSSEGEASTKSLDELDAFLRVVRRDMGHKNQGLKEPTNEMFGDLVGLMLTDKKREQALPKDGN